MNQIKVPVDGEYSSEIEHLAFSKQPTKREIEQFKASGWEYEGHFGEPRFYSFRKVKKN